MAIYTSITQTEKLRSDAADSIQRAVSHGGMPLEINDAYRSDEEQEGLFYDNYTPNYSASAKFDRRKYNGVYYWRRPGNTVSVAVPGTSNHGTGIAIDLGVNARAWMFKHGAYYGWTNPAWAKEKDTYEPWHWEYNGSNDKSKGQWSDMPELVKFEASKDQTLKAGGWNTVKINDKGYVSLVIGSKSFDADVWVRLSGVDKTATVQGRLYKVSYDSKTGKSKRVYTYSDSLTEMVGTAGSTFFKFGVKGGCESGAERVRAEIQVYDNKGTVKIIEAGTRSQVW